MTRRPAAKCLAAACLAALLAAVGAAKPLHAQVNVTTYHYDNLRTGWNSGETALTQSNVAGSTFGLLGAFTLDDQVDAQPLLVTNENIAGGQHNVLYIATEHNSVYALDAQSGQVLLHASLGAPVSSSQIPDGCYNNGPDIGIDSTPAIDLPNGVMYVVAYTWENSAPVFRIHELSLTTLMDKVTPVVVSGSGVLTDGSNYSFNAGVQRQRAALLLANGNVYAGFGSFCDVEANLSRGWLFGWAGGSLSPLASNKLNDTLAKSPNNFFLSSIWMSGFGPAANANGSIYYSTGNTDKSGTTFNQVTNISESVAEMSPDLSTLQGLFTPPNHIWLDEHDKDFGSGGAMLLPQQSGTYPDLAVAAGKDGTLYLFDADSPQTLFGSYTIGGCWCGPSFFTGSDGVGRVVTSGGSTMGVWQVQTGSTPSLVLQSQHTGIRGGQMPGFFTSVSSNGTTAGSDVIWAVSRPRKRKPGVILLYAFNPESGALLYEKQAGYWLNTGGDANIVPVVANGYVYVASDQEFAIFGLGYAGKSDIPEPKYVETRVALQPGQHEIYGIVESMSARTLLVKKRDGSELSIETGDAQRGHRLVESDKGDGLVARGTIDRNGVMHAISVHHASMHPEMWPDDR